MQTWFGLFTVLATYPLWCGWFVEIDNDIVAQFDLRFSIQFDKV